MGEWLKQTGREVARAAGNELKSVAKDKAASYAWDLIGMGLKEALGDAAGAVGRAAMDEAKAQGKHKAKPLRSSQYTFLQLQRRLGMRTPTRRCFR